MLTTDTQTSPNMQALTGAEAASLVAPEVNALIAPCPLPLRAPHAGRPRLEARRRRQARRAGRS